MMRRLRILVSGLVLAALAVVAVTAIGASLAVPIDVDFEQALDTDTLAYENIDTDTTVLGDTDGQVFLKEITYEEGDWFRSTTSYYGGDQQWADLEKESASGPPAWDGTDDCFDETGADGYIDSDGYYHADYVDVDTGSGVRQYRVGPHAKPNFMATRLSGAALSLPSGGERPVSVRFLTSPANDSDSTVDAYTLDWYFAADWCDANDASACDPNNTGEVCDETLTTCGCTDSTDCPSGNCDTAAGVCRGVTTATIADHAQIGSANRDSSNADCTVTTAGTGVLARANNSSPSCDSGEESLDEVVCTNPDTGDDLERVEISYGADLAGPLAVSLDLSADNNTTQGTDYDDIFRDGSATDYDGWYASADGTSGTLKATDNGGNVNAIWYGVSWSETVDDGGNDPLPYGDIVLYVECRDGSGWVPAGSYSSGIFGDTPSATNAIDLDLDTDAGTVENCRTTEVRFDADITAYFDGGQLAQGSIVGPSLDGVTFHFDPDDDDDGYGVTGHRPDGTSDSNLADCNDDPTTFTDDLGNTLDGSQINDGANEIPGNNVDEDCDGQLTCWVDADGDGYGDPGNTTTIAYTGTESCATASGVADNADDCDDDDANVKPEATEICDGRQNDCDAWDPQAGEQVPADEVDHDSDGWVECTTWVGSVTGIEGGGDCVPSTGDHADAAEIHPGAAETEDPNADFCMKDADQDGYGDDSNSSGSDPWAEGTDCDDDNARAWSTCTTCGDDDSDGWYADCDAYPVNGGPDCDDGDANVKPGASEICDGRQNDCDDWHPQNGEQVPADEVDHDSDGWVECTSWVGSVAGIEGGGDCVPDDTTYTNPGRIHPGAAEIDDPSANACMKDDDQDGYGDNSNSGGSDPWDVGNDCLDDSSNVFASYTNPGASEICDGNDNDCSGSAGADELDDDSDGYAECTLYSDNDLTVTTSNWGTGHAGTGQTIDGGDDCLDDPNDEFAWYTNPGAGEICDGNDNDCSGAAAADEFDDDVDGYVECDLYSDNDLTVTTANWGGGLDPTGETIDGGGDCLDDPNDEFAWYTNPGAGEICDGNDNDCSGAAAADEFDHDADGYAECTLYSDNDLTVTTSNWGDGANPTNESITGGEDCLDDPSNEFAEYTNPGAGEICDGNDNDCSGAAAADEFDDDVDGYVECDLFSDNDLTVTTGNWGTGHAGTGESITGGEDCLDDPSNDFAWYTNPGAGEICDGNDNDCSGAAAADEFDIDGDAYVECDLFSDGDLTVATSNWGMGHAGTGESIQGGSDCAPDPNAEEGAEHTYPGAPDICDGDVNDCNDTTLPPDEIDGDDDGYVDCTFFTDADTEITKDEWGDGYLGSAETLDGDADCDDTADYIRPDLAFNEADSSLCYKDRDGDGFGDSTTGQAFEAGTDCNDSASSCTSDCTLDVDADGAIDCLDLCRDVDSDGFGEDRGEATVGTDADPIGDCVTGTSASCAYQDGECAEDLPDCDDDDPFTFPGAAPQDSVDDCMRDRDEDGYGDAHAPAGIVDGSDCDDGSDFTFPGAAEQESLSDCMRDEDDDGYGSANLSQAQLGAGVIAGDDCTDAPSGAQGTDLAGNATSLPGDEINPDQDETWYDGIDQDCDGANDYDQDFDGYAHEDASGSQAGSLDSGDCHDDPNNPLEGTALNGSTKFIDAASVYPGTSRTDNEVFYDGVDQNCFGDSDFDADGDGVDCDTSNDARCPTEANGGLDCDDGAPSIKPGETEIWYDGIDQNCDDHSDFDQDFDGYDCDGDLRPDLCEGHSGLDCDDTNGARNPTADEVCDPGTTQIDADCDGNPNTQQGQYFNDPTQLEQGITTSLSPFYIDKDGDSEGEAGSDPIYLCDRTAEDNPTQFVDNDNDCNDNNQLVFSGADERCNGADDNCNGEVDEPTVGLDPADAPAGCITHYLDDDEDGYGTDDIDGETLCVCSGYSTDPEHKPDTCNPLNADDDPDTNTNNVEFEGRCWSLSNGDCADNDQAIHPTTGGEHVEKVDGIDNNCDGRLALIELDCDNDGSYAMLEGLTDRDTEFSTPGDVGLVDCAEVEAPPTVRCFDTDLGLICDDSGFWVVNTSLLVELEVFSSGRRVGQGVEGTDCSTNGWDCDDACTLRCEGNDEVCDGVDNDCEDARSVLDFTDDDGVPNTMDRTLVKLGKVSSDELDLDGDTLIECSGTPGPSQDRITEFGCNAKEPGADCDNLCALVNPNMGEDLCNGFQSQDVCEDVPADLDEGEDDDDDLYRTCGAWGLEEGTEAIYTLVYAEGSLTADEDDNYDATIVPLIPPRDRAPTCDAVLAEQLDAATAPAREADTWWEPALETCIAADVCRETGGDDEGWPTTAACAELEDVHCGVAELRITGSEDSNLDEMTIPGCLQEGEGPIEEAITRTVWRRDRIVEARRLVVEWECYRLDGTFGCDDDADTPEGWASPYSDLIPGNGGFVDNPLPTELLTSDTTWWKEFTRYNPRSRGEMLVGCWGDPRGSGVPIATDGFQYTGGDCDPTTDAAHRDNPEGPGDLVGVYLGELADCSTCLDGIDNNCNGAVDCADLACAQCFVGQGIGCGGGSEDKCTKSGCDSSGPGSPGPGGLVMLFGLALAATGTRRWGER